MLVEDGVCKRRETVSDIIQVFGQQFIDSRKATFAFETVFGWRLGHPPTLTFSTGEFQLRQTDAGVLLVTRDNPSLYYILHFRGEKADEKFMEYMAPFVES